MSAAAVSITNPQLIQLDSNPNQSWQVSVLIDGAVQTFFIQLAYNEIAQYWVMTISDSNQNVLVSSLPLVTGLNLLQQFSYLEIGSLFIVNVSGVEAPNYPNNTDLGTDFMLFWADTAILVEAVA